MKKLWRNNVHVNLQYSKIDHLVKMKNDLLPVTYDSMRIVAKDFLIQ